MHICFPCCPHCPWRCSRPRRTANAARWGGLLARPAPTLHPLRCCKGDAPVQRQRQRQQWQQEQPQPRQPQGQPRPRPAPNPCSLPTTLAGREWNASCMPGCGGQVHPRLGARGRAQTYNRSVCGCIRAAAGRRAPHQPSPLSSCLALATVRPAAQQRALMGWPNAMLTQPHGSATDEPEYDDESCTVVKLQVRSTAAPVARALPGIVYVRSVHASHGCCAAGVWCSHGQCVPPCAGGDLWGHQQVAAQV